jgi:hypothetical protein
MIAGVASTDGAAARFEFAGVAAGLAGGPLFDTTEPLLHAAFESAASSATVTSKIANNFACVFVFLSIFGSILILDLFEFVKAEYCGMKP